jgi:serine/threonine protein kinase
MKYVASMLTGTVVAHRYLVQAKVRTPPNGDVYLAVDRLVEGSVEVKTLERDDPPEGGRGRTPASRLAYLRQEERALTLIRSEHVQRLLRVDVDTQIGPVLVFNPSEGEALTDRLKRTGPIPAADLHPLIEQVWFGLVAVHEAGVVHRDLKPSNLLVSRRGDGVPRVEIIGFDFARPPGGDDITEMGESLGAFSFMPPEQIGRTKTVDARADIYACATLVFQSLSGQLPYAARNILVMVELKGKTDARRLSEAMPGPVDPRLEAFLARGLARDPRERFASAADALAAWRALAPAAPRG